MKALKKILLIFGTIIYMHTHLIANNFLKKQDLSLKAEAKTPNLKPLVQQGLVSGFSTLFNTAPKWYNAMYYLGQLTEEGVLNAYTKTVELYEWLKKNPRIMQNEYAMKILKLRYPLLGIILSAYAMDYIYKIPLTEKMYHKKITETKAIWYNTLKSSPLTIFKLDSTSSLPQAYQIKAYLMAIKEILQQKDTKIETVYSLANSAADTYKTFHTYVPYSLFAHSHWRRYIYEGPYYELLRNIATAESALKAGNTTIGALKSKAIQALDYFINYWAQSLFDIAYHKIRYPRAI